MIDFSFYKKLLRYQLFSRHKYGHGVHSPFVYRLITDVFRDKTRYDDYKIIEKFRSELLKTPQKIAVTDLGAGSKFNNSQEPTIRSIVKHSSVRARYGKLLYRLVKYFKPSLIIELGTSVGMSTLYLAKANPEAKIHTIEGCPEKASVAKRIFKTLQNKNIEQHIGNFDTVLPEILKRTDTVDFVFFDGNHRKEAMQRYFSSCLKKIHNNSVFIIDDIHWSEGMETFWQWVKQHEKTVLCIDLFSFGLVFFRNEMQKQNMVIKF